MEQAPNSKSDLRFQLEEAQLSNETSGDTEAAPPSTLYDPGFLALKSPEVLAKVAEREARNQNVQQSPTSADESQSPFHIMSPTSGALKKPFADDQDVERRAARERELEVCCCGLLPLYPSVVAMNAVNIFVGLIAIGIGAHQVRTGSKTINGFDNLESAIISGVYVCAIGFVVLGLALIVCGGIGCSNGVARWKNPQAERKLLDLAHQSLLLLLALVFLIIFGLAVVALSLASRRVVYDSANWANTVQGDPGYACKVEEELTCAGFQVKQCVFDNNETSNSFCPGHFCIDFCRQATNDVNSALMCDPCAKVEVADLINCKELEKAITKDTACEELLNQALRRDYQWLLGAGSICLAWVFVNVFVSVYQLCCA